MRHGKKFDRFCQICYFFSYQKISLNDFFKFYFRLVETCKLSLEYKRLITIVEFAPGIC